MERERERKKRERDRERERKIGDVISNKIYEQMLIFYFKAAHLMINNTDLVTSTKEIL